MRAVFIHTGSAPYFHYTLKQAVRSGMPVTLIGDQEAHTCAPPEVDRVPISDYLEDTGPMTTAYRHLSSNPEGYERFCFERWFILRAWIERHPGPAAMLDSDVLIYPGLANMLSRLAHNGAWLLNTPWCAPIWRLELLDKLLYRFIDLFSDPAVIRAVSEAANLGRTHVSDMHMLQWLAVVEPDLFYDARTIGRRIGLCSNIQAHGGWEAFLSYRKPIGWHADRPVFRRIDTGHTVAFSLLHFQGRSKFLMDRFCAFDTGAMPELKAWFRNPANEAHHQYHDAKAFDTYLAEHFSKPLPAVTNREPVSTTVRQSAGWRQIGKLVSPLGRWR